MVYMYSYTNKWESFRVLYEWLPRTLRTPLNSPYLSVHSEHSNRFKRVKHFEQLGLSHKLKEIDFNTLQCVER